MSAHWFREEFGMAKLTAAQIQEQTEKVRDAIAKHKRESKEENFTSLSDEEIVAKLKRVKSPMMVSAGWSSTTPGGTFNYSVSLLNPDPIAASNLYVHVWVGSANADPTVGTFLLNVDSRFPRLTQPPAFGLTLPASGGSTTLNFSIKVPASVEKSNYIGNSCLMRISYLDIGQYLDRGCFPFSVT
jgi:hypothetical protein